MHCYRRDKYFANFILSWSDLESDLNGDSQNPPSAPNSLWYRNATSGRVIDIVGLCGTSSLSIFGRYEGNRARLRCIRVNLDNPICRMSFFFCLLSIGNCSRLNFRRNSEYVSPRFDPSIYLCISFFFATINLLSTDPSINLSFFT